MAAVDRIKIIDRMNVRVVADQDTTYCIIDVYAGEALALSEKSHLGSQIIVVTPDNEFGSVELPRYHYPILVKDNMIYYYSSQAIYQIGFSDQESTLLQELDQLDYESHSYLWFLCSEDAIDVYMATSMPSAPGGTQEVLLATVAV